MQLLRAAASFWHIHAQIETSAQGLVIKSGPRVLEIRADTTSVSGWWLHIDDMPALRAASVSAVLREVRLELDPAFVPGKAIIGARDGLE